MTQDIRRIAIVGMGALGTAYAHAMLSHPAGREVFGLIPQQESRARVPLSVNAEPLPIALYDPQENPPLADLVLVAVKWHHLPAAIQAMDRVVGPHTQILSFLNGISSEEVLARTYGWERVLYATVSGADTRRDGHNVIAKHLGAVLFGEKRNAPPSQRVQRVADCLQEMRIPHRIPEDMELALWQKLMVNVGFNQVSAVLGLTYGQFRLKPEAMELMRQAQREVIAVANALHVALGEADITAWEAQLWTLSEHGMSSSLQDVLAHRKTEVELYGGEISRLGRQLGIPTPVNESLLERLHQIEASYL